MFLESSTRSILAASACCPGLSVRFRSTRKSTPAGFSLEIWGRIRSSLVFMAAMISLFERAISESFHNESFDKGCRQSEKIDDE